jgi:HSP20 family protein
MTTETTKNPVPAATTSAQEARFIPPVDIFESPEGYEIVAEMPGCDPSAIEVRLEDGVLLVYGKVAPREAAGSKVLAREFEQGDYGRTFRVTDTIDSAKISAEYVNGVLTVRLPKVEAAKPRKIEVRSA